MEEPTLGKRAFEMHKRMSHGRSQTGKKLGKWSQLTSQQREEWEAAAATMQRMLEMKAEYAKN